MSAPRENARRLTDRQRKALEAVRQVDFLGIHSRDVPGGRLTLWLLKRRGLVDTILPHEWYRITPAGRAALEADPPDCI